MVLDKGGKNLNFPWLAMLCIKFKIELYIVKLINTCTNCAF